jgi:hypothetical protein
MLMIKICHAGLLTLVVSFLRESHGKKLACTSSAVRRFLLEVTESRGFKWRAHDDIEEVLERVRQRFDFGPECFPWSKGVGWRKCLELCARAMEKARSDEVVRVIAPANPQPLGILGWAGFKVARGREHEWRELMLTMATGDTFKGRVPEDYRFLPENPTWCVYKMLVDLGFRQVSPRDMPRANHPQRLKQPDQLWCREWWYSEDNTFKQLCREIADLKAEVLRGPPAPCV